MVTKVRKWTTPPCLAVLAVLARVL